MLEGPRIVLRPVNLEDVNPRYCDWLNDPEVNRYLETRSQIQTLDTVAAYVRRITSDPEQFFWAICVKESGAHIGNIKIGPVSAQHRRAAVSLFIGEKTLWGRGYAAEAVAFASDFAFKVLRLNRLHAGAYADNTPSIRIFENCGYRREGTLRQHALADGRYTDVIQLGRLAADQAPCVPRA